MFLECTFLPGRIGAVVSNDNNSCEAQQTVDLAHGGFERRGTTKNTGGVGLKGPPLGHRTAA